jgi:DNA-binding MarR family transcriptional regulator
MIDFTPVFTENNHGSLQDWRQRYESLGLVTIPLSGKSPIDQASWKETSPQDQWMRLAADFKGNIGIIAGDGVSVVDADNTETAIAVDYGFKSMGLSPATVLTPRGKHFYLNIANVPKEFNWCRLSIGLCKGELRARNSYVVAPCSQINGISYQWEKGGPEALRSQAVVEWEDLLWLLPEQPTDPLIKEIPVRLLYRDIPRKAKDLLETLRGVKKGQVVDKYGSRSEAEAAVIAMLILAGRSYDDILRVFIERSPGKFHDAKGKDKQSYFDRTYHRALSKIAAHPTRQEIAEAWVAAQSNPFWPGGNGYLTRDTYLGLLAICWQFGSWQVGASERDLAEYAAASQAGVHHALERLVKRQIIQRQTPRQSLDEANSWIVNPLGNVSSQVMIYDNFSRGDIPDLAELWSPTKLGRTAGTVYSLLAELPVSIGQLAHHTGKAWSTLKSALKKLEGVDLAIKQETGWIRGGGNLGEIARKFESSKAASYRRSYHKRQRESFAELIANRQKQEKK